MYPKVYPKMYPGLISNGGRMAYILRKRANHLLDCEGMQIAAAVMAKR